MAKFTNAWRATLTGYFNAGDQPTEAQFTQLILSIQEGIEEHQHDGTGDGDGIANLGPLLSLTMAEDAWVGIGAALERIVFDGSNDNIALQTAHVSTGTHLTGLNRLLVGSGGGSEGITIWAGNGAGNNSRIFFADALGVVGEWAGYLQYLHVDDSMHFGTAATTRITISGAGAMQWPAYGAGALTTDAAGNITAVSDIRLKEQVRTTKIGLAEVLQLQGKAWHYTKESGLDTECEYIGFIADDIEKIVPGAVGQMQDGMKTLNPNALLPAFAKAIQELDARLTKGGL